MAEGRDGGVLRVLESRPAVQRRAVIEQLEGALEQARRGEIVSVALAGVLTNGDGFQRWSAADNGRELLGSVTILQVALAGHINESSVDCE